MTERTLRLHFISFGETGAEVLVDFTGTPPFRLVYTRQRQGKRHPERIETPRYDSPHKKIDLKPTEPGHYIYVSFCRSNSHL